MALEAHRERLAPDHLMGAIVSLAMEDFHAERRQAGLRDI